MKTFPKYTNAPNFVGYPLFYVLNQETVLCADCCTDQYNEESGDHIESEVNYDDENLYCWECSEKIESAYGENDQEELEQ